MKYRINFSTTIDPFGTMAPTLEIEAAEFRHNEFGMTDFTTKTKLLVATFRTDAIFSIICSIDDKTFYVKKVIQEALPEIKEIN